MVFALVVKRASPRVAIVQLGACDGSSPRRCGTGTLLLRGIGTGFPTLPRLKLDGRLFCIRFKSVGLASIFIERKRKVNEPASQFVKIVQHWRFRSESY